MRIVAIDAGHGAFRQPVLVGPLETGPDVGVALGALRVDVGRFARHQAVRSVLVNRVARGATHLVFGMTAINASDMGGLVQMAGEAELVGFGGLEFGRVADVGGGHRFGVFAAGSMARFAGFGLPAALLIGFHDLVRVLLKGVEDIFVASLAGGGADEFGRFVIGRPAGAAAVSGRPVFPGRPPQRG